MPRVVIAIIMPNNGTRQYQESANLSVRYMTQQTFYLDQKLNDFDEFCFNARNWDLDYRQLESGRFSSELLMIGNDTTIFTRAKLGRRILQKGAPPQGLITFGLLVDPIVNIYWRNIDVSGDKLFIFPPGGELHSITQADFDVFVVSLTEQKLNQVCASLELPEFHCLIDRNEVFQCDSQMLSAFRHGLLSFERELTMSNDLSSYSMQLEQLEHELAERLIRIVAKSQHPITRKPARKRDHALQAAENFIHESGNCVVTIPELCDTCNVSERTLEYAFRERYGMTPKAYTLIHRLNNVRKHLRAADPETNQVSTIAQQHDFWHMGQFSSSYRKLFAERPSETLKATA